MADERAQMAAQFYSEMTSKPKKKRKRAGTDVFGKDMSLDNIGSHASSIQSNYRSDDDDDDGDDGGASSDFVHPEDIESGSIGFSAVVREMKNMPDVPSDSEERSIPLPMPPYDSKWSSGVKGKGVESTKKPAPPKTNKKKKKNADESIDVVPHAPAAGCDGAPIYKSLPLAQIRLENFRLNHNVSINKNDEIDLDDTSCESSDSEDDPLSLRSAASGGADDDNDDEFAVRRVKRAALNDDNDDDDPLDNEFDFEDEGQRNEVRDKIARSMKPKKRPRRERPDRVASQLGRLNNCFLCAWGKRNYDSVNNMHMENLLKLCYHNIGEMPLEYIAMAMHGYYKNVIKPAAETRGQILPRMRSKHFFICLMSHNHIPEIKLQHDLSVMETLQGFLERKVAIKTLGSSEETPVRHLLKELRETIVLKWKLQGLPMNKMAFHRSDRDIKMGGDRMYFRGIELQKATSRAGAPLAVKSSKPK